MGCVGKHAGGRVVALALAIVAAGTRVEAAPASETQRVLMLFSEAKDLPANVLLEQIAQLLSASDAPVYVMFDTMLGPGPVGGAVVDFASVGRRAGQMAARILAGESPGEIPIEIRTNGVPMLDWQALRRAGVSESRLPPGSVVRFRPPTLWADHKDYVLGGLCIIAAQTATIAALLVHRARRRRAEAEVRESEKRMALVADAASLGMWVWDIPRSRIWMSDSGKRLYGFAADVEVTLERIRARVHPEDRAIREEALQRALGDSGRYNPQYRLLLPDGTLRWLAADGRVERDANGKPVRMLGVSIDITERHNAESAARDLGGRLINAQEDERRRIGRDLHDDLNQRLALLSIEMDILRRTGHDKGEDTASLDQMGEQVKEMSAEVHKLSYQLHPAKLYQLGLVSAGRSFCRELSRQSAVHIDFIVENVPAAVPEELALCCYRVIQESLGNMVRHSGAREARVELSAKEQQLRVVVSDGGRGFDAGTARLNGGLGLVSMNERVRLLHGNFEIRSAPGKGTRIELAVPLPPPVSSGPEIQTTLEI